MKGARLLVVEDDPAILIGLDEKLRREGYEVVTAADGERAREVLADADLDLVVLDIMLPRLDGLSVLRWLRKERSDLPVLILSAKGREEEKVEGLAAGADDYLPKPFGLKELVARIDALLRRAHGFEKRVEFGAVVVDLRNRQVTRNGEAVALSRKEMELLFCLARNKGRIVTREDLLTAVWGHSPSSGARAVDFHVLNLRRKLEEDPSAPRHLITHHGVGYQLVE
jgi:DNA-binding response OmpR family regulator